MRLTTILWCFCFLMACPDRSESASGRSAASPYFRDGFLDTLQRRTFLYFWEQSDPVRGMTPDRAPTRTFSSVAATGFALTCYPIGAERGYVTRAAAAKRVRAALKFFHTAPQSSDASKASGYRGFFYHFLDLETGLRFERTELSTIDTALLLAGMLFCQSYFDRRTTEETEIRALADSIYRRIEWNWAMNGGPTLSMGWHPEDGFIRARWRGYNEAMLLYVLALGSPTHPIPDTAWSAWTDTYIWAPYYGMPFVSFGPLFGHQYSHCWIDFRGIRDEYMRARQIDYFENSRRAVYSQQAYAKENPRRFRGYSDSVWGLTACDGPGSFTLRVDGAKRTFDGYAARGCSFDWVNDDGTIAPTAAGGSLAFAPEIALPALRAMKARYGERVYRRYGFIDAFNPTCVKDAPEGWFDHDYLGIDQGPIVIMIENLRNEFVWKTMKKNPYIIRGLRRAGFGGGWLDAAKESRH
ncbi:MAG: glucoamylase family protein [Acidobacteriota bacterium]